MAQMVKNPPAMWETWVRPLEDPLKEGNGNPFQYSCLPGVSSWIEEPGGLQSMESQSQTLLLLLLLGLSRFSHVRLCGTP